jgi:hypothetical protein
MAICEARATCQIPVFGNPNLDNKRGCGLMVAQEVISTVTQIQMNVTERN